MGRHLQAMKSAVQILSSAPYRKYIKTIYLYGSCAKGTQKYSSDVDLFVECDESFTLEIGREMRLAIMPDAKDAPEVELKFITNTCWKQNQDPFSRNLRKDGILLWKKQ